MTAPRERRRYSTFPFVSRGASWSSSQALAKRQLRTTVAREAPLASAISSVRWAGKIPARPCRAQSDPISSSRFSASCTAIQSVRRSISSSAWRPSARSSSTKGRPPHAFAAACAQIVDDEVADRRAATASNARGSGSRPRRRARGARRPRSRSSVALSVGSPARATQDASARVRAAVDRPPSSARFPRRDRPHASRAEHVR